MTATILQVKGVGNETVVAETSKGNTAIVSSIMPESDSDAFFHSMADSLPEEIQSRVFFDAVDTVKTLQDCVERAKVEVGLSPKNAGDLVVLGRGSQGTSHDGSDVSKGEIDQVLSPMSSAMISGNVKASILVIQAAREVI